MTNQNNGHKDIHSLKLDITQRYLQLRSVQSRALVLLSRVEHTFLHGSKFANYEV